MDNFLRRLKYYGLGFGIGLIFVIFFFQNRGCSWFPENRVKNVILRNVLVVNEEGEKQMQKLGLVDSTLVQAINLGDVDFPASDKKSTSKIYYFNCKTNSGKSFNCHVSLNETSFISEVIFSKNPSNKVKISKEGYGKFIHFPVKKDFVYLDSTEIDECKLLNWPFSNENQVLQSIMTTGKLNFATSQLELKPRPLQVIEFQDKKSRPITVNAIWYKEKIQIVKIDLGYENECDKEKRLE